MIALMMQISTQPATDKEAAYHSSEESVDDSDDQDEDKSAEESKPDGPKVSVRTSSTIDSPKKKRTKKREGKGKPSASSKPTDEVQPRPAHALPPPSQPEELKLKGKASPDLPVFDDNTIYDVMAGLEKCVDSRKFTKSDVGTELSREDYRDSKQFFVRRKDLPLLKFKDFAPKVFYQIRLNCGITNADYLRSFSKFDNLHAVKGEGKSGAFFIFTKDKQFILKTVTGEERDFLWETLPYYFLHMFKNPDSLLPRIYGVYSMKHQGPGGVTRFIIMNNVFNTPYEPVEKFDLKGSVVGRVTSERKRKSGAILKDQDIVELKKKLHLAPEKRTALINQLIKDTEFLATFRVMDYSLLVGVYYPTEKNKDTIEANLKKRNEGGYIAMKPNEFQDYFGGVKAHGREEIYFIGIIDVLIEYAAKKKVEHLLKFIAYAGAEVSVVEPEFYRERFNKFVIDNLLTIPDVIQEEPKGAESDKSDDISDFEDEKKEKEDKKEEKKDEKKDEKKEDKKEEKKEDKKEEKPKEKEPSKEKEDKKESQKEIRDSLSTSNDAKKSKNAINVNKKVK
uniref:PIPK domain-containing protein n=1 Tax=Arcella intermedia TaxID=1963864 RepID=A0A6B2L0V3_9EUKA